MRINTDGVLLASIAVHDHPSRILDIGTGTGVIALMLAQRYPASTIDAIEIDASAAVTAAKNFRQSPFGDRLTVQQIAFEYFTADTTYDMIVSNPPFFVNDLVSQDRRKGVARHAHPDFFDTLSIRCASLLSSNGVVWLVIPPDRAELLSVRAPNAGLSLVKKITLRSYAHTEVFREITCYSKTEMTFIQSDFIIYDSQGVYSEAYRNLLKDFFLLF